MAARYLVGERSSISLQATALVNELCLRLLGWDPVPWQNRGHFFGVSARMMRRVLVDIARRRRAERRGGPNAVRVPLDSIEIPASEPGADLLAVDDGAPDARFGGPAQGPGRGTSLLWRSLDRGDRGGARDIGPHGSRGLGVRAGLAVPNADRRPCPLTAGIVSSELFTEAVEQPAGDACGFPRPHVWPRCRPAGRDRVAADRRGAIGRLSRRARARGLRAADLPRGLECSAGRSYRLLHGRAAAGSGRDGRGVAGARRAARARRGDQAASSASFERRRTSARVSAARRAPPAPSITPTS